MFAAFVSSEVQEEIAYAWLLQLSFQTVNDRWINIFQEITSPIKRV